VIATAQESLGTPSGVLIATKQKLLDEGWGQPGAYGGERGFEGEHGFIGWHCVYDALVNRVLGGPLATRRAVGFLCEAAGVDNSRDLTAWNDARGRTIDDVLAALD
jgi:hypothetical protein